MLLGASSSYVGQGVELRAVTDGQIASGVAYGQVLIRFAEAVCARDDRALPACRQAVIDAVGPAGFVDAAAVIANFNLVVRVADATGIPLDDPTDLATAAVRDELGINAFHPAAAAQSLLQRALGRLMQRAVPVIFRVPALITAMDRLSGLKDRAQEWRRQRR